VADHILQAARVDTGNLAWRDKIHESGRALRDALLSHTDGAELVSASFAAGQSAVMTDVLGRLGDAAVDAGVATANAELTARTVVYYVLGFTVDEQSRRQWDAAGAELPEGPSLLTDDPDARFDFGVQLLIDGILARREQRV
jgi:hypothetical protein